MRPPIALLLAALAAAPAAGYLLTGPIHGSFCQVADIAVGTDGTTFLFPNGIQHPVPPELQPTAQFTFLTLPVDPSDGFHFLISRRGGTPTECTGGSRMSFHHIPAEDGAPLEAILLDLCLEHGLASSCYFLRPGSGSPQRLAVLVENHPATSPEQAITWVDLEASVAARSMFLEPINFSSRIALATYGNAALVEHDIDSPFGSDWAVIELCPGSLGTLLANFEDLDTGVTARVTQTAPGDYVARLSHPALPGGEDDVALTDCLAPFLPPPGWHRLEVRFHGPGNGRIFDIVPGFEIDCHFDGDPNDCFGFYPDNQSVRLSAFPTGFLSWAGDCAGTNPDNATFTMDRSRTCVACYGEGATCDLVLSDGFENGSTLTWTETQP